MRRGKHRKARGHGQPDPRKGQGREVVRTQSKYGGNNEECPTCGITYGRFKTGLTYYEVWLMFWTPPDAPLDEWKYTRRGTILGKWFEIKQDEWAQHKDECEQQAEHASRQVDLIQIDDEDLSDVPF